MKNVYAVSRWRYLLVMGSSFLLASFLVRYISGLVSEPEPLSFLEIFLRTGLTLGILILFIATPMIKLGDIEVSPAGVVGLVSKGFFQGEERAILLQ